jgi:hypothetical protein
LGEQYRYFIYIYIYTHIPTGVSAKSAASNFTANWLQNYP